MSPFASQLARIQRYRWLVLGVALVGLLAAVATGLLQRTEYTGRAALTTVSQSRSPEQDAYLAQGYADFFNEPAYQSLLHDRLNLPAGISAQARTAATSPIIYVEATGTDADAVASAASALATALRDDVNAGLQSDIADRAGAIQKQIDDGRARLDSDQIPDLERSQIPQGLNDLQSRLADIRSDTTNQLKDLQLDAGVSSKGPNIPQNALLGLLGGLVLGLAAALTLGAIRNRIATPHDVRTWLGLPVLAVLPSRPGEEEDGKRMRALKGLAGQIALTADGGHLRLAITSPTAVNAKSEVAEGLATFRAAQDGTTLLIQADPSDRRQGEHGEVPAGFVDLLKDTASQGIEHKLLPGWTDGLTLLPNGRSTTTSFALYTPERVRTVVDAASEVAGTVIVDAPPVVEMAECQATCSAADRIILVIEEDGVRAADAAEAVRTLRQTGPSIMGVVLVKARAGRRQGVAPADPVETVIQSQTDTAEPADERAVVEERLEPLPTPQPAPAAEYDGADPDEPEVDDADVHEPTSERDGAAARNLLFERPDVAGATRSRKPGPSDSETTSDDQHLVDAETVKVKAVAGRAGMRRGHDDTSSLPTDVDVRA